MKKLIALLLTVIFVMSALSACSFLGIPIGKRPAPTAPAATSPAATTAPATETAAPATQAPATTAPVSIGSLGDYVKTLKEKEVSFGNGKTNTLRLPEILIDSTDAKSANDEIVEKFGEVVNGDANSTGAYELDYEAYLNKNILSVVITSKYDGGNSYGLAYDFDVATGKALDSAALCEAIGKSYNTELDKLYEELVEYYEDKWGTLPGNETEKEKTYNYANLKAAVMYLDGDGDLMALVDTYAAVGGGHWVAQIEID